jgi:hypothetical protein
MRCVRERTHLALIMKSLARHIAQKAEGHTPQYLFQFFLFIPSGYFKRTSVKLN